MAKSNDTLILNADGSPLSVLPLSTMSWTDAVKLYYLDRVSIIETYEFWKARSPSLTLAVPSVIMMREYSKPPSAVKFSRKNVYLRDNFTCQYCGEQHLDYMHHLTLDHVVPKAKGGKTNWTNIVAACMACNSKRRTMSRVGSQLQFQSSLTISRLRIRLSHSRSSFPMKLGCLISIGTLTLLS